jgi:hypothetical protein
MDDVFNEDLMISLAQGQGEDLDISKLPGMVNIPICTWAEIKANWKKGDESSGTYPCNGV